MNRSDVKKAIEFYNHDITEVRIFNSRDRAGALTGYYDLHHIDKLIQDIAPHDGKTTISINVNAIAPELFKQAPNCLKALKTASGNKDVLRISKLIIDIDTRRPPDSSSTAEELTRTKAKRDAVINYLKVLGLPEPHLKVMSGNGCHVIYKIDPPLQVKEAWKIKAILKHLHNKFTDDTAEIDVSLASPCKVLKIPGTTACKGKNTQDRPHRTSLIESINNDDDGIDIDELLQQIPHEQQQEEEAPEELDLIPGEIPAYIKELLAAGITHERNITLFKACRDLFTCNVTETEALSILQAINAKGDPVSQSELKSIFRQGRKYKQKQPKQKLQDRRKRKIKWMEAFEPPPLLEFSVEEIRKTLPIEINSFINDGDNNGKILFVKLPPGTGKTNAIIDLSKKRNILAFEPDDLKSKELEDAYFKYIRGRDKRNLKGTPLCTNIEQVKLLQNKGYGKQTQKIVCKNCEYYKNLKTSKNCEYYKQYPRKAPDSLKSIVSNHAMLFTGLEKILSHNSIDAIVIDENILSQFIDTVIIDENKLINILGVIEHSTDFVFKAHLGDVFKPISNLFNKYKAAEKGVFIAGNSLIKELGGNKFTQLLEEAPEQKIPDDVTPANAPYNFINTIIENLKSNTENVTFVRTHAGTMQLIINIKRDAPKELFNYPIIYLDATGNADIIRKLFKTDVREIDYDVKPAGEMKIYQNFLRTNTSYSVKSKGREQTLLHEMESDGLIIDEKTLIICTADLEPKLKEIYPQALFNHYNAGRGRNSFVNCNKVIIANAPKINFDEIINTALALGIIDSRAEAKTIQQYEPTGYIENEQELFIEVLQFANENLNALLYQRRESEIIQQVHRIRPLLKNYTEIYINTNLPIPGIIPNVAIYKKKQVIKKQDEFNLLHEFIDDAIIKNGFYCDEFFNKIPETLEPSNCNAWKTLVIYNNLITTTFQAPVYQCFSEMSKPTYRKYRNEYFENNCHPVNKLTLQINNQYRTLNIYGDVEKAKEFFKNYLYIKEEKINGDVLFTFEEMEALGKATEEKWKIIKMLGAEAAANLEKFKQDVMLLLIPKPPPQWMPMMTA